MIIFRAFYIRSSIVQLAWLIADCRFPSLRKLKLHYRALLFTGG